MKLFDIGREIYNKDKEIISEEREDNLSKMEKVLPALKHYLRNKNIHVTLNDIKTSIPIKDITIETNSTFDIINPTKGKSHKLVLHIDESFRNFLGNHEAVLFNQFLSKFAKYFSLQGLEIDIDYI